MDCIKHGKPLRQLGATLICASCLTEGAVSARELIELRDKVQGERDLMIRRSAAKLPQAFSQCTLSTWVAQTERAGKIRDSLGGYCSNFEHQRAVRSGFIFTGRPGTGKTHLACAMVNGLLQGGFSPRYLSLPAFTRALKASFGRMGESDQLIKACIAADFLVVDEIDLHGTSDADYNALYDIINGRYEIGGRPTVAISNRSVEHLTCDLDERIVSRLLGSTKPVVFDWPGRRAAAPQQMARA